MIIYKATNIVNQKVYIGLTSRPLSKRKTEHFWDAKNYAYNSKFHKALRKYGEKSFSWEIIDYAHNMEELNERESYWISFYNSNKEGYNLTSGGLGATGYKYTDEDKKKVSMAHRGEKSSSATIVEEVAKVIINLLVETNMSYKEISEKTNVSISIIKQINHGQSWKHLYDIKPIEQNPIKRPTSKHSISGGSLDKLRDLLCTDLPLREIAKKLGVTHPTVIRTMERNSLRR